MAVLTLLGLIWVGVIFGFGGDIARHVRSHAPPYPIIVHIHAVLFGGWLALLTTQVILVEQGRPELHRRLGVLALGLVPLMLAVGAGTALVSHRAAVGAPGEPPPAFLSVQILGLIGFGGFAAAGLVLRKAAPAHKRLMLLATLSVTDAGFSRWTGHLFSTWWGEGFGGFWAEMYLANDAMILALGAYDLVTRRQLHPAYAIGIAWMVGSQLAATGLYFAPAWGAFTSALVGR